VEIRFPKTYFMNLKDLFTNDKLLQTKKIFAATEAVTVIQIKKDGQLKEHVTTIDAILFCVMGDVVFENEKAVKEVLLPGDYVNIEPHVKHWVVANADSYLLLVK
jgi:quercetin dioxygenase-like cupin family protein